MKHATRIKLVKIEWLEKLSTQIIHLKKFVQFNEAVRVDIYFSKDFVHLGTRNVLTLTLLNTRQKEGTNKEG